MGDKSFSRYHQQSQQENCSVLIAIGVNNDGYLEILGACEGLKEDAEIYSCSQTKGEGGCQDAQSNPFPGRQSSSPRKSHSCCRKTPEYASGKSCPKSGGKHCRDTNVHEFSYGIFLLLILTNSILQINKVLDYHSIISNDFFTFH